MTKIRRGAPFTAAEERELAARMRSGDRGARDRFISANRPLVFAIAKSLSGGRGEVSSEDLVAEGMVGLVEAADRFDPDRARFSTHATYWIRMRMLRAMVDQAGPLRFKTRSMRGAWWRIGRTLRAMFASGEAVSYESVAERLGVSSADVRAVVVTRARGHASLDAARSTEEGVRETLGDELSADHDPQGTAADEDARRAAVAELARAVGCLTPRERRVVSLRFRERPVTLKEIGAELGLTRERVRQIEARALAKLAYAMPRDASGAVRLVEARALAVETGAINFSD